ncbi:hypothetical protein FB382_001170 [Nocardioides ginsengisegetis]|uniref:Camelysin metallo-endopeptidase n=1 Tax=Nocardioides ginsengisegetis TaxID=661491 RepID=A0A7W3IYG6_9ACTN|nr:TasA family protein [Nocardioides ginsengisegetis]MBA8802879.1 hypothetical protein [Nocardioides ginsengisegetis]
MATSLLSTTTAKVLASVVLVGGAASVAGLGTFGSFTSSTSASANVTSGVVQLGLNQGAVATTVAATQVLPGDTIQRAVTLTRSAGTESFGSVKMTTSTSTPNLLTSDATNGLQLAIDSCSVAWTKGASDNSLSCSGTTTSVLASRAVIGTNLDLAAATTALNANAGSAGAVNLRLSMVLPTAADNTFQGLTNAVTFTFDATQKATATYR